MHTSFGNPCVIQSGEYSSTHIMETTMGNEGEWAKTHHMDQLEGIWPEVKHITTDMDTKAYLAAKALYADWKLPEENHNVC